MYDVGDRIGWSFAYTLHTRHMIHKRIQGSIIAIASICAHVATRPQTHIPYNASKAVSAVTKEKKTKDLIVVSL